MNSGREDVQVILYLGWHIACSRLSVVGSEKRESERKNVGGVRRTPRLSPLSFFSPSFSLVPNYREPGTGIVSIEKIYQTLETVFHRDIQTPRISSKILRCASFFQFNSLLGVWISR